MPHPQSKTHRWAPGQTGGHREGSWSPVLALNTAAQTQVRARRQAARMLGKERLVLTAMPLPGPRLQGNQGLCASTPWPPIAL